MTSRPSGSSSSTAMAALTTTVTGNPRRSRVRRTASGSVSRLGRGAAVIDVGAEGWPEGSGGR